MKSLHLLAVVTLLVPPLAGAQAPSGVDHAAHHPAAPASATHKAAGVVKSADRGKGSVLMAHGPVATLKWPAMTMSFLVKDKGLLDKLPAGAKVEFEFVLQGRDYVITGVK